MVLIGSVIAVPAAFSLLCMVSGAMTGLATPYPCLAVTVWSGSPRLWPRKSPAWLTCTMYGSHTPCFALPTAVGNGSCMSCTRGAWPFASPYPMGTMNGLAALITNLSTPRATRRMVLGRSGRWATSPYFSLTSSRVSKMDGHGRLQSMISAALRHGFFFPALTSSLSMGAWVGSGQTTGHPSHLAIRKNRLRVVGAP